MRYTPRTRMVSFEGLMRPERYGLLIVEDDEDLRFLIRAYLRTDKRLDVVAEAASAEEGLAHARAENPHLIVLDHVLEGELMGIDAAPLFKEIAPDAKILLFTASADPDHALAQPAVDVYLMKTEISMLLKTIQALLGLERP